MPKAMEDGTRTTGGQLMSAKVMGRRIRELRQQADLSQREFAAVCGISYSMLSGIESGTVTRRAGIARIARFLAEVLPGDHSADVIEAELLDLVDGDYAPESSLEGYTEKVERRRDAAAVPLAAVLARRELREQLGKTGKGSTLSDLFKDVGRTDPAALVEELLTFSDRLQKRLEVAGINPEIDTFSPTSETD